MYIYNVVCILYTNYIDKLQNYLKITTSKLRIHITLHEYNMS